MWTIVARFVEAAASVSHYIREEPCATGLHMMVARGSSEPAGLGRIGVVARNVTLLIPGSTIEAIDYPATFTNYSDSEEKGAIAFEKRLIDYHERCPDTKVALLGYSQGAHAMMDSLCGNSGEGNDYQASKGYLDVFNETVVAAVAYGDPSHTVDGPDGGAPWNLGTSTNNGIFPRENMTSCRPLASRIASWCDTGDIYCDAGADSTVHGGYFGNYTMETVNWIVEKYKASIAAGGSDSGNSTSTVPAPSSTSTTSSGVAAPTGSGSAVVSATPSASASGAPVEGAAVSLRGSGVMVLACVAGAVGMGLGLF
ncbi:cutinase-domain-containing protein [Pseudoneurospora amorphoporcata]|uniref:Cutinase-domain-containing protein n=1 Tax=Pseudoneurospora amorphoporcata TaxID=241081 RepID=A0AAN6NTE9_9PEZI|nr:cutinase-domain-containing protein [Pseudoneurospora amorphoporcata]